MNLIKFIIISAKIKYTKCSIYKWHILSKLLVENVSKLQSILNTKTSNDNEYNTNNDDINSWEQCELLR